MGCKIIPLIPKYGKSVMGGEKLIGLSIAEYRKDVQKQYNETIKKLLDNMLLSQK